MLPLVVSLTNTYGEKQLKEKQNKFLFLWVAFALVFNHFKRSVQLQTPPLTQNPTTKSHLSKTQ